MMMTSLFSNFDPCSSLFIPNWMSTFSSMIFIPYIFWLTNNRYTILSKKIFTHFHNELKMLILNNKLLNGLTLLLISIFIYIVFNNFMGLFPYIFTSSSHLIMVLSIAAPLWLSFMIYGWLINTNHMFTHLVPMSTPNILMPFMVLIESISNIIRPGTLTVRLSANMIAGHLLLTLLGNQTSHSFNSLILFLLLMTQILLLTLESAVAIIQAYVFTVLSTLYSNEV